MIWIVVGGQYGSEGKGAFCAYLARGWGFMAAVRGGGPQAGHTFYDSRFGGKCVVRQVPVACVVDPNCLGYIGPGAIVDLEVLRGEIAKYELRDRCWVHPLATVLVPEHKAMELQISEMGHIPGSTREGVGAARATRALRRADTIGQLSKDIGWMQSCVDLDLRVYKQVLEHAAQHGHRVLAEGTQGFGLSLYHGFYPYVTSADTTPAAVLSECGLPLSNVERTIVVLRTYPIRVGGQSGPFQSREIDWPDIGRDPEKTTVTGRDRRIAAFEWHEFHRMLAVVRPDYAALTFCDYLDKDIYSKPITECPAVHDFWLEVHKRVRTPWIGVGGEKFEFRGAMTGVIVPAGQEDLFHGQN